MLVGVVMIRGGGRDLTCIGAQSAFAKPCRSRSAKEDNLEFKAELRFAKIIERQAIFNNAH